MHNHPLTVALLAREHQRRLLVQASDARLKRHLRNGRREVPRLLSLWRAGRLDLEGMITSRRPLAEVNEGFADMQAGVGLRTVLNF